MRNKLLLEIRSGKTLRFLAVLLAFPVCLILSGKTYAQEKQQITGKVIESTSGLPLPGVSVLVKGTSTGSITDIDGNYSIGAEPTDVLVFSYMGYLTEEKPVGTSTVIDVSLVEDIIGLDEVVAHRQAMQKWIEVRLGQAQRLSQITLLAQIAAHLEEQIRWSRAGPSRLRRLQPA